MSPGSLMSSKSLGSLMSPKSPGSLMSSKSPGSLMSSKTPGSLMSSNYYPRMMWEPDVIQLSLYRHSQWVQYYR